MVKWSDEGTLAEEAATNGALSIEARNSMEVGSPIALPEGGKGPSKTRSNSGLVGSAGEHYVLYKLHLQGMLSAPAPRGYKAVDIIVWNPKGSIAASIQVKTRTYGRDGGWHMGEKHEAVKEPSLFYCFVDFEPAAPVTYVVPSRVVAEVVARAHRAWLAIPGKRGQPHKDSEFRRVQPSYAYPVPGFAPGWMNEYRENWELLRKTATPGARSAKFRATTRCAGTVSARPSATRRAVERAVR